MSWISMAFGAPPGVPHLLAAMLLLVAALIVWNEGSKDRKFSYMTPIFAGMMALVGVMLLGPCIRPHYLVPLFTLENAIGLKPTKPRV